MNTRFIIPLYDNTINDCFSYGCEERRRFKEKEKIRFLVQDHHCIPYQYRNHPLLKETRFNINCSRNILIMPNKLGIQEMNFHPNIRIHDGGHISYNKYIGKYLDKIYIEEKSIEMKQYQLWLFLHYLKGNLYYNNDIIPWL
tara:strand:- start:315 stop:740 length:426 start_codon:yes stop_codon:yes gene_type:complete